MRFQTFTEGRWRYAEVVFERPRKMTAAVESHLVGDLLYRCRPLLAQLLGGLP